MTAVAGRVHPTGLRHELRAALLAALGVLGAGCAPRGGSHPQLAAQALPPEGALAALPLGDLAGRAAVTTAALLPNPLGGNAGAIAEGHRLYVAMNCAGCHGYDARGNMGPNLTDAYWRYGGTPAGIYNSIYAGRPKGMPAWGRALPAEDIWKIVAWLQTLGGTIAADQYQAGLQGDHDVTSIAGEVQDAALRPAPAAAAVAPGSIAPP